MQTLYINEYPETQALHLPLFPKIYGDKQLEQETELQLLQ